MAIGAHELLLIVRAQNQASGLLGRISRDFRRLQNMRDLDMRRSQIVNQLARNSLAQQAQQAKIQSIMSANGKIRLQHEQNINRLTIQGVNIENRMAALGIRRTAIDRARSNLEVQRLRMERQELTIESQLEKVESRRLALNNQLRGVGVQMLRNQAAQAKNDLLKGSTGLGLRAQVIERQLAQQKALSSYMSAVSKGGAVKGSPQDLRLQATTLRTQQAQAALAELTGNTNILKASMAGLQERIVMNQKAFDDLVFVEKDLAAQSAILEERQVSLEHQLANLGFRTAAVTATEKELKAALVVNTLEIQKQDAVWAEHITAVRAAQGQIHILTEQEKMLRASLLETDAAMAAQRPEQMATLARGVSHIGRVLQLTGLVGVAAFGAMGVAAAHFNTEAVRAATQTGDINSTADTVVKNSKKIQDAVTSEMMSIPASSQDLTNSLYYIYSTLNTTLGQGTKLLKVFGDAWVAGGMVGNVEDVSTALVTLANNWGITADQMGAFRKLANSTLATVRFGGLTLEQYTQTMNQLAPAFHGANQSVEQMNASIAFLTRLLPSSHVAAAGIARMMQQLQRLAAHPAAGFEGMAKAITDSTGNLKPLDKVLAIIIKMRPEIVSSGVALQNFWRDATGNTGTIQAQRAFQAFVKQFGLYQDILKQTSGDQKELNRALAAFRETAGFKWKLFTTQMHAFALEIGVYVLPMLLQLAAPLQKLAQWFNGLSDAQKKNYGHWAALIAAGVLVTGVVLSIAGAVTAAIIGFRTMGGVLGPILGLTGRQSGILGSKIGLLITGFILINHLTHSWGKTLAWLFNIMAALTLRKMITSIGILDASIISTTGATITLRNAMIGLQAATLGEIAVIVFLAYELSKLLDKIPLVRKAGEALGHALYKMMHPDEHDTQVTVKNLQTIREEIRKTKAEAEKRADKPWWQKIFNFDSHDPILRAIGNVTGMNQKNIFTPSHDIFQQDIKQMTAIFTAWKINHVKYTKKQKEDILLEAFPELDIHALRILMKAAARQVMVDKSMWTEKSRLANFGEVPVTIATPRFTDQEMIAAARKAAKLYKAEQDAANQPDPKKYIAAWRAYNNFVKNTTKDLTKPQIKMWDDLLNFMENLPAPTKPLAFIVEMDKQVNKLHDAAMKSNGDIPKWQKYAAALKLLQKIATPQQLSLADEIVASLKNATNGATRATPAMVNAALAIERVQKAAEASPRTSALWDQLDKLSKAFSKMGTPEQQSNAQTIAQAINAITSSATRATPAMVQAALAIERIQKAAELDPTKSSLWDQLDKASKAFAKMGTPEQQSNAQMIAQAILAAGQNAQYSTPYILSLAKAVERLKTAAALDPTNLAKQMAAAKAEANLQAKGTPDQLGAISTVLGATPIVSQATINKLTFQKDALAKIANVAPKSRVVALWTQYYAIVDKLGVLARGHQQEIADALSAIAGTGSSISLQAAIRLQKEIQHLQDVANKTPTTANWMKYFNAVKKLAASASQEFKINPHR